MHSGLDFDRLASHNRVREIKRAEKRLENVDRVPHSHSHRRLTRKRKRVDYPRRYCVGNSKLMANARNIALEREQIEIELIGDFLLRLP